MQPQSTKDYKKFKIMESNRKVSLVHVQKILYSMTRNPDLFQYRPILVNREMYIIDGQHRFKAAEKLGLPIWYVIGEDLTIKDTQAMNVDQRNWSPLDFARSFAALGKPSYVAYLKFHEDHPGLPHNLLFALLAKMAPLNGGGARAMAFKEGTFIVTPETIQEADVYADMLEDIRKVSSALIESHSTSFYVAAIRMIRSDGYNHDQFMKNLNRRAAIPYRPNAKAYMHELEDIYNYKRTTGRVSFF